MTNKLEPDLEGVKYLHSYAWDWFSYHAKQRLVMFRFYLILLAVLTAGYLNCIEETNCLLASVISLFGVFVTIVFFVLEVRNERLVGEGKAALLAIEKHNCFNQFDESVRLMHCDIKRPFITSYKIWMWVFYSICLVVFVSAAVYVNLPSKELASDVTPSQQIIADPNRKTFNVNANMPLQSTR